MSPTRIVCDLIHPCHTLASVHHAESTHECVLSQISMHHMSHISTRHVPNTMESCPTYQRVMSHMGIKSTTHKPHTNACCLKYQSHRHVSVSTSMWISHLGIGALTSHVWIIKSRIYIKYMYIIKYMYFCHLYRIWHACVCVCECVCVCVCMRERERCQTYQCVNITHINHACHEYVSV